MNQMHNLQGEQKNQILVTCDKYGRIDGYATREDCHKNRGIIHLAFMAYIKDQNGNLILAKRSQSKSLWSGFWDATVVSHVLPGETPVQAALRRGKEEMGVEVNFQKIGKFYYFAPHGVSCENEVCIVLLGKIDSDIIPNPVEISEVKKMTVSDLIEDLKTNRAQYTPWLIKSFNLEKVIPIKKYQ